MTEFFRQLFASLAAVLIIAVVLVLEWHGIRRCFIKVKCPVKLLAWFIQQFFLAGATVIIAVLGFYFYDWIINSIEPTKAMVLSVFIGGIIIVYSCIIVASWVSEKRGVWSAWIKRAC